MESASVYAVSLADQADRCRRLAARIGDDAAHGALLTLAAEYEARVLIAINGAQPGDLLEDCPSLPPQRPRRSAISQVTSRE